MPDLLCLPLPTLTRRNCHAFKPCKVDSTVVPPTTTSTSCTVDRLPDEILMCILTVPNMDMETLCSLSQTCKRIHTLAVCVLRYRRLPHIELTTVIDQEGRRRSTSFFRFVSLDEGSLCATFAVQTLVPRRFRSEADDPVLRLLMVTDYAYQRHTNRMPSRLPNRKRHTFAYDAFPFSLLSPLSPFSSPPPSSTSSSSPLSAGVPRSPHYIPRRKLRTRQDGLQTIESYTPALPCQPRQFAWRFTYVVSKSRVNPGERYITPMYIIIHLSFLGHHNPPCMKRYRAWFGSFCAWVRRCCGADQRTPA